MIPQIDTAEQARIAVSAAKFSPRGSRGTCRFVRSAAYGAIPGADYFAKAQDTMVILQAEGQKAIDNLDDILSVEGVDIVFVGPYDLSASLGIIGQINHPKVMELIGRDLPQGGSKGRAGGLLRRLCGVRQEGCWKWVSALWDIPAIPRSL